MSRAAVRSADVLGLSVLMVTLAWSQTVDRLDIVKLWVATLCVLTLGVFRCFRGAAPARGPGLLVFVAGVFALTFSSSRAGFEAWLPPWLGLATWWWSDRSSPSRLFVWLVIAGMVQGGLAVSGVLGDPFGLAAEVSFRGRAAVGTFGNPTLLGVWLASVIAVIPRSQWPPAWSLGAIACIAAGILATESRLALGLMVGVLFVQEVFLDTASSGRRARLALIVLFAGLAGVRALADGGAWSERASIFVLTLQRHPGPWWLGLGPEGFALHWADWRAGTPLEHLDLRHAHNDALEWFVDFGVLGLAFWSLPLVVSWRAVRGCDEARRCAGLGVLALALGSMFQPTLVWATGSVLAGALLSVVCPVSNDASGRREWAVPLVGLVATCLALTSIRFVSEVERCKATRARIEGRESLGVALAAARIDESNDRAWLEAAMASDADRAIVRQALRRIRLKGLRLPDRFTR